MRAAPGVVCGFMVPVSPGLHSFLWKEQQSGERLVPWECHQCSADDSGVVGVSNHMQVHRPSAVATRREPRCSAELELGGFAEAEFGLL